MSLVTWYAGNLWLVSGISARSRSAQPVAAIHGSLRAAARHDQPGQAELGEGRVRYPGRRGGNIAASASARALA